MRRVVVLPRRPLPGGEGIAPAEAIPIIDMERERHKVPPEARFVFEFAQPRFGRRTTAAAFRSKELDQVRPGSATLESRVAAASHGGGGEAHGDDKEERLLHVSVRAASAGIFHEE